LDIYSVWLSDAANFRGSWVTARVYPRVFTLFSCIKPSHPFTRHFVFLSTQQHKFLEKKTANNGQNSESIHRISILSIHNLRGFRGETWRNRTLESPSRKWELNISDLKKPVGTVRTKFIWLRRRTSGGLLCTQLIKLRVP
jgi:hypothetical protein